MTARIKHEVRSLSRKTTKKLKKVRETKQRRASKKLLKEYK